MNQPLTDARGHHVEITQNDHYLLLHDLDTGRITSVDLRRMGFTGSLDVGTRSDYTVALTGDTAALIDMTKGTVRGLDPATLHETKARLQLPGPLVGGAFDAHGALWLGMPSQGTVASVNLSKTAATVARTEAALSPGHQMAMTVLDAGALAVDRDGDRLALVTDTVHPLTSPYPLSGAVLPARTVGGLSAVTLPATGRVVTVDGADAHATVGSFPLAPGTTPGPATPFSGKIYVPDAKQHTVFVYDRSGHRAENLGLAGAEGPLQLEVREGHLMINAPDSSMARVVDPDGVTRLVDKYQSNAPGNNGDLAVIAAPAPQASTHNPKAGNGKAQQPDPGNQQQQQTGPPGPPVPVTALAGNHQVALSWPQPSTNGAAIQHYDVSYDGKTQRVGGTSVTINNLTNNKAYSFSVTATNRYGTSPPALSQEVTPTSKLPDTPTNVTATVDARSGSVTVTWKSTYQAANYVVQPSGGGAPTNATDTSVSPQGLTPGQTYTFTVVAQSGTGGASGPSAPSNPVVPFTIPGAPPDLQVSAVTVNSVTITWGAAPDNGSPVTGYTPLLDGVKYGNPLTGDVRTHTFPNLTSGQQHTFSVYATNAAGNGPPADVTGQAGAKPTVSVSSKSADANSITVKFTVDWQGSGTGTCKLSVSGAGSASGCGGSLTVDGLAGGTSYDFTLTASNAYGSDSATGSVTTDTVGGVVVCDNTNGSSYCGQVGLYSSPSQGSSLLAQESSGTRGQAKCYAPTSDGKSVHAYVYNHNKTSKDWIKVTIGSTTGYIPYAWFNLDGEAVGPWDYNTDVTPNAVSAC
jgi:hypothetical protein